MPKGIYKRKKHKHRLRVKPPPPPTWRLLNQGKPIEENPPAPLKPPNIAVQIENLIQSLKQLEEKLYG